MNKHIIKNIVIFFIIEFVLLASGNLNRSFASASGDPDRIYMVFNKSFYISGETIWYKIFLLNKNTETRVVHIGIFNSSGKLLVDQKLEVENATANGSVQIPIEWPDDHYRFEALTRWNLNFGGTGIFEKSIAIYNSSVPGNNTAMNYKTLSPDSLIQASGLYARRLYLSLDKNMYQPGDSVRLKIEPKEADNTYNLCVSVTDLSQIQPDVQNPFSDNSGSLTSNATRSINGPFAFKPEKKLLLEGTVMKSDRSAIINSKVLSVYLSGQNVFIRTGTENGSFITELPDFNREEVVQVFDLNPFQEHMPFVKQVSIWDHITFGASAETPPQHTGQIDQYIYHTRLRRKINEIFINPAPVSFYSGDSLLNSPPLPDMHYEMSKFKLLTDFADFIKSVMLNVRRVRENGNTALRLFNDQTQYYFMYHPWYLVDGLFSYDEPLMLTTPFSSMTTLDFYTNYKSIYHFDPLMIMNGVIRITTNDEHWEKEILSYPNTLRYQGFYSGEPFIKSHPELIPGNSETPDLRPIVYWNPDVIAGSAHPAILCFKATDNTGLFLVEISGTDNAGKIVHSTAVYRVKNH